MKVVNMRKRGTVLLFLALMAGVLLLVGCGRKDEEPAAPVVSQAAVEAALATVPADWAIVTAEDVLARRPFLVDVREPHEYATGFIEWAVNIPVRTLARHLEALPGLDKEIVLVCCSGPRSTIALAVLRTLGYQDVRFLSGGVNGWRAAGFPLVGGPGPTLAAGPSPGIDPDLRAAVDDYLSNRFPDNWGQVELAEFNDLLETAPPFLLDVRQPEELEGGEIDAAVNIPLRQVPAQLASIPRDQPVIVLDASGYRSTIVMAALQMLGYEQVTSLSGGVMGWQAAGGSGEYTEVTGALEAYLATASPTWGLIEAEAALTAGPFWLDVRSADAYATGFITGAVNIPLRELTDRLDALPDSAVRIVVVGDSTTQAGIGMLALQVLGYREASSLAGGLQSWEAAGLPLVTEQVPEFATGEPPAVEPKVLDALAHYLTSAMPPDLGLMDVPGFLEATDDSLPGVPVTVIDLRDAEAFASNAIKGAVNLPLSQLLKGVGEIPAEPLRTS